MLPTDRLMRSLVISALFCLLGNCLLGKPASADQRKNAQSGSIELEADSQQVDPYTDAQTKAEAFVRDLQAKLTVGASQPASITQPADPVIRYLAGIYLLCSMKRGPCPAVIETVYEADLVNARLSKVPACPITKKFWKLYLDGDYEKRLQFSTQTGFVGAFAEFNQKVRPKYIKCEQAIKEQLADPRPNPDYFKARYVAAKPPVSSLKAVGDMIAEVKAKNVNVFSAAGAE